MFMSFSFGGEFGSIIKAWLLGPNHSSLALSRTWCSLEYWSVGVLEHWNAEVMENPN
jgi:hypothetical protein